MSNNKLQWGLCLDHLHSTPLKARYRGFILHTWATPCQGVCAVPAEGDTLLDGGAEAYHHEIVDGKQHSTTCTVFVGPHASEKAMASIDRAWAKAEVALASLDHEVYHNGKT